MDEQDQQRRTNPGSRYTSSEPEADRLSGEKKSDVHPLYGSSGPTSSRLRGRRVSLLTIVFMLLVSASAGFAGGWIGSQSKGASESDVRTQQVVMKSQGDVISNIAETVGESVVSVEVTSQTTTRGFFGGSRVSEQESAGTGIILDKDGLIITNRHVVPTGTTEVVVRLADGTELPAEVKGRTSNNDTLDIAFLQITDRKNKTLSPAIIGDSGDMKVGDPVVAIGNALGQFQNTVTSGIISGFGRNVQAATDSYGSDNENLENLFQTDTAINQGNSGGPLVNLDGEVIGINTAVADSAENIGFAIPINDVKSLIASIKEKGTLERPYLGVMYIPVTADVVKEYKLTADKGAYIPFASVIDQDSIVDNGPADKAGIKEGDIITKVGNETISDKHSLTSLLRKQSVGSKVVLTIIRDGKTMTLTATLTAEPSTD